MFPEEIFFLVELEHRALEIGTVEEMDSFRSHDELLRFIRISLGYLAEFAGDKFLYILDNLLGDWVFLTVGQGGEQKECK